MSATTGGAGAPRAKGGNTVGRRKECARGWALQKASPSKARKLFSRHIFAPFSPKNR